MDKNYKGLIWTNHAIERMQQRGVAQNDAYATWNNPDQSRYAQSRGAWVYYKDLRDRQIEVVAKQNEKKQWLIISVWAKNAVKHQKYNEEKTKKESLFIVLLKKILKI